MLSVKMPTNFKDEQLKEKIARELRIKEFSFHIENKSLDARNKRNIHWEIRVVVNSPEIKGGEYNESETLEIPFNVHLLLPYL